ncbi:MAG: hypothetical protein HUU20_22970 [Pirellulales bacterium]|nr:hypothetical protein [Pirellulales bacterium]
MSHADTQIDATFYQMIERSAFPAGGQSEDRRRHRRQRYCSTQWIAPWDGCGFPGESDFIEAQCHDLTPGGFSFLSLRRPDFKRLVVGFGRKPDLIFLGAETVRCTPVLVFSSGQLHHLRHGETPIRRRGPNGEIGRPMILVGCRFTLRLERPAPSD